MQKLFVLSHTHWDREWYEPFQVFRARLVRSIDKLLDLFDGNPAFEHFMLDGQTIVLEDYFEVRPDREQRLQDLIRAGRVAVGPWYVLPDEFLVSGESIIRNLARGMRIACEMGGTMRIGYIPDPFGHISQMPQILRGFGMSTAVFRRGLADEPLELWWQAPDGTRVLTSYLRDSYDNIAFLPYDETGFAEGIATVRESLGTHSATGSLLLMNGTDHMEPWQDLPRFLAFTQARMPDAEFVHASLASYMDAVRSDVAANKRDLPVVSGELRNPKRHHMLPGVTSTRMWIKQRNAHAQMLLEKWAEPFVAFATWQAGQAAVATPVSNFREPNSNIHLLSTAWKYLLQNHPHDSICGCGADATHADMAPRFDWVEQIANPLIDDSLTALANSIDTQARDTETSLVVFNPTAAPRTDVVQADVEVAFSPDELVIVDDTGDHMPCRVLERRVEAYDRAPSKAGIEWIARDVPGFGYRTFQVVRHAGNPAADNRAPHLIENEFLRVVPSAVDGTLTITDKQSGAVLNGANRFVDGGDRGDLYNYNPPENDTPVMRPAAAPQIAVERDAVRQSVHIALDYLLPAQLSPDRASRAAASVHESIVVSVSLYPGVPRIDFRVEVNNFARDHRLRVEFPTGIATDHSRAEQAFDVVDRAIALPADTAGWIEQPRPEAPMQSFVCIDDGKQGLMLTTRGLPEYEARRDATGVTLALTLLRCTGWLSRGDLTTRSGDAGPRLATPGAQEIGKHVFEYALIPYAGDWQAARRQAHAFAAPMRAVATRQHTGALPRACSFVRVSPDEFIVTAIKPPEHGRGLVVRGYNIGDKPIEVQLALWRGFDQVARVDLDESLLAPLERREGNLVQLGVRPREIVTLRFE